MTIDISVLALCVSVAALGAAIWAHAREHRLGKRTLALEEARERDRKLKATKAQLRGWIDDWQKPDGRLVIENTGDSEARNVVVMMDGKCIDTLPAAKTGEDAITRIGAQCHTVTLLGIGRETTPPCRLDLSWEDDSDEPGHCQTMMHL